MLIDEFMQTYDFDEKHETIVRASAETVYAALNSFDFNESMVIRWLFRFRGLASKNSCDTTEKTLTLRDMTKFGFVILGEKPNEEILFGLVGKFWKPTGDLQKINAEDFLDFDKSGYAKAIWNFALTESTAKETRLTTETRVRRADDASRSQFGFYWTFIKPFSGWIRREALRLAKEKAEGEIKMIDWQDLAKQRKSAEAEISMLTETERETGYGYETLTRAGFYEDWGDSCRNKTEAKEHYEKSLSGYQLFASWSTGSGEGLERMINVERLEKKLARLK
jgi:hypothetical protein